MDIGALIPWILMIAFWLFVIWAVVALIRVLRDILAQLRVIEGHLGRISERGGDDGSNPQGAP
jgi:hypothetical protein